MKNPHIHVEAALEACGVCSKASRSGMSPDVIGQPTVGEADELAPLEHHYLGLFVFNDGRGPADAPRLHHPQSGSVSSAKDSAQHEMTNKLGIF